MKTLRVLAVSVAVFAATNSAFAADEKIVTDDNAVSSSGMLFNAPEFLKPLSLRVEGGTVGYGAAAVYDLDPTTSLVVGYNGGDASDLIGGTVRYDGVKYDVDQDNNTPYVNIEVRPLSSARWFNMAFGVGFIDNDYSITQANHTGFINVNDKYFDATQANLKGKVSYDNHIAPFVGVGITPQLSKNIGLFAQVGAFYNGNPKVELDSTEVINAKGESLQAALKEERNNIANDDKYEWLPVGKVGLSFRF